MVWRKKWGLVPFTVSKWCTNSSQPDLETLYKIADLLHLDIRDLLVGNRNTDD
jgi:transcriptional regulator with XRE-family HTH domain